MTEPKDETAEKETENTEDIPEVSEEQKESERQFEILKQRITHSS